MLFYIYSAKEREIQHKHQERMQKFITGQAIHPRRETIAKRGLKSM
jgi:hypothetical protein